MPEAGQGWFLISLLVWFFISQQVRGRVVIQHVWVVFPHISQIIPYHLPRKVCSQLFAGLLVRWHPGKRTRSCKVSNLRFAMVVDHWSINPWLILFSAAAANMSPNNPSTAPGQQELQKHQPPSRVLDQMRDPVNLAVIPSLCIAVPEAFIRWL